MGSRNLWGGQMTQTPFRFARPDKLAIVKNPNLSVAVVIACRNGQEKLDLLLASLSAQSYPAKLMSVHIIDDGSDQALVVPAIAPSKTKVIRYKNGTGKWGKTAATNDVASSLKADVLWFVDADMIFERDHLAHHMKWHHDNDDYAVLGWKKFVKEWNYDAREVFNYVSRGNYQLMHSESWGKELWEARVSRTKDLVHPALDGYRAFVGATFSVKSSLWKKIGGYNRELITGEDTELGWRLFMAGIRIVPERDAHSWHLGYSTVEKNKEEIDRHNQPALAQFIPEMKKVRANSSHSWSVPTYEVLIDARNSNLQQILKIKAQLLSLPGTQARFTLLGNWAQLKKRYAPVGDPYADIRELFNWLRGDESFAFEEIGLENIEIQSVLDRFTDSAVPFHLFIDGDIEVELDCKQLSDYLLSTEFGLVGVVTAKDKRAFAVFQPALARARSIKGASYKNIESTWGVSWLTYETFVGMHSGKNFRTTRFINFLKREGKKINSPLQLLVFIKKILRILIRKIIKK